MDKDNVGFRFLGKDKLLPLIREHFGCLDDADPSCFYYKKGSTFEEDYEHLVYFDESDNFFKVCHSINDGKESVCCYLNDGRGVVVNPPPGF